LCISAIPCFAIGGIGPENIAQITRLGVRCVAVSSAVLSAADPSAAAQALKKHMLQL